MDFLPTLAAIAGGKVPDDRIIDGIDLSDHLTGAKSTTERDTFLYYFKKNIEAVRSGDWKLHIKRKQEDVKELYNLRSDVGEQQNVYDKHPDIVAEITEITTAARKDLGDGSTNDPGTGCRKAGYVENPKTLTTYDPNHPYYIAMYDLEDCG